MTHAQILSETSLPEPVAVLAEATTTKNEEVPLLRSISKEPDRGDKRPPPPVLPWVGLYLLFFALPTLILLEGYLVYHQSLYTDQLERQIEIYTTELNSRRNHISYDRVLRKIADDFRESFLRAGARPGHAENVFRVTLEELPADSIIAAWNGHGELISPESFSGSIQSELRLLARLLIDEYHLVTEGGRSETASNGSDDFERQSTTQTGVTELCRLLGEKHSIPQIAAKNRQAIRFPDAETPTVLYWDLFRPRDVSQGGFIMLVPSAGLTDIFNLSYVFPRDTGNPAFTSGFYLSEDIARAQHSYPGLDNRVQDYLARYRSAIESPMIHDDWTLIVCPLSEGSGINLFCLFSTQEQREKLVETERFGSIVALFTLLLGLFGCVHLYKKTQHSGLSIRVKLGGLFLLSMYLPFSLLSLLGLQFSLSKAKVLETAAKDRLKRELKQLEIRAIEHYRVRGSEFRELKKLPAIREVNLEKIRQLFLDMRKQISRVYLVKADGQIIFDIDHLHGEVGRKPFISTIGRHIVKTDDSILRQAEVSMDLTAYELLNPRFLALLTQNQGALHQVFWPGDRQKSLFFAESIVTELGRYALLLVLDKPAVDHDFLLRSAKMQLQRDPDLSIFAIDRQDFSKSVPNLSFTFKSDLLRLLAVVQSKEDIEIQKTPGSQNSQLIALVGGRILDGFFLGIAQDWHQIVASINWWYTVTAVLLAISLSGSLIMVVILARGFLKPISILATGTQALTAGDLLHVLPVTGNDELGELSQAFNHMTRRLRSRLHELTVLYQLTQRASTSHNQRELFELAYQYLRDHLGATDGGICWTNEGEGVGNLYLVEPREARENEIIRASLVSAIQNRTFHQAELPNGRDVYSIPLFFEEKEFGGLYLIFPDPKPMQGANARFNADEISFIETLRHHLSLIIEKQHLFEQAITDGLTRLFVRRFFLANLEKELARGKRYKTDIALVLLDIDHFKMFNDTYGHQTGDFVLRETAQRIIENIRAVDTPGRYGGEELAIALPQTSLSAAFVVAEKVRKAIGETSYEFQGQKLTVTVSLGVTALGVRRINVEEFIAEVDKALYSAKANGRNRTELAQIVTEDLP